jgi:hypothetical protein
MAGNITERINLEAAVPETRSFVTVVARNLEEDGN